MNFLEQANASHLYEALQMNYISCPCTLAHVSYETIPFMPKILYQKLSKEAFCQVCAEIVGEKKFYQKNAGKAIIACFRCLFT